jgi:hypothetical protein
LYDVHALGDLESVPLGEGDRWVIALEDEEHD